jgi:predicted DNA-binding ribbon-helix-helix protein
LPAKLTRMADALPRRPVRPRDSAPSSLVIRNIVVAGHRTSVRLEPAMWEALREIARQRATTVNDLVTEIDRSREASSLTAAIRVYIVGFYRSAAAQAGCVSELRRPALPM